MTEPNYLTHGDSMDRDKVQEAWDRLTAKEQNERRLEYVKLVLESGDDLDGVSEEAFWDWLGQ